MPVVSQRLLVLCLIMAGYFSCSTGIVLAAEKPFDVTVLTKDAGSPQTPRNITLKLHIPNSRTMPLNVTVETLKLYLFPDGVSLKSPNREQYRCSGLFIKQLRDDYYVDVRTLPKNLGFSAHLGVVIEQGTLHYQQTYPRAVSFSDERTSVVLVVDTSYSMRRTDPQRLRVSAAKSFVDQAARSLGKGGSIAEVGVVRFSSTASVLSAFTASTNRQQLHAALDQLDQTGRTNIDSALDRAFTLFEKATYTHKVAILLSDGKNEVGRFQNAHRRYKNEGITLYTIGLSAEADADLLSYIAKETGGVYYSAPSQKDLHAIYQEIGSTLQKRAVVHSSEGTLTQTNQEIKVVVDPTLKQVEFSLVAPNEVSFELESPDKKIMTPQTARDIFTKGEGYGVYHLKKPKPGIWKVRAVLAHDKKKRSLQYRLRVEGDSGLYVEPLYFTGSYLRGEPIDIACSVAEAGKVLTGVLVEAHIRSPEGKVSKLILKDDGNHADTQFHDGVFSNIYTAAYTAGIYAVSLKVKGITTGGKTFTRSSSYTISVSDKPFDGLKISQKVLDLGVVLAGSTIHKKFTLAVQSGKNLNVNLKMKGLDAAHFTSKLPSHVTVKNQQVVDLSITIAKKTTNQMCRGELSLTTKYATTHIPVIFSVVTPQILFMKNPILLPDVGRGATTKSTFSFSLTPPPPKPVQVRVSYGPLKDREGTIIAGAVLTGPKNIQAHKKSTDSTFSVTTPSDLKVKKMFSWIYLESPFYSGKIQIEVNRFDALLAPSISRLDFGTIYKLPFKAERSFLLKGTFKGREPLSYSIETNSSAKGTIKSSWFQLKGGSHITSETQTEVKVQLNLPHKIDAGALDAVLKITSTNGEARIPLSCFMSSISKRITFEITDELAPVALSLNERVYQEIPIQSSIAQHQKLRIVVLEAHGFKVTPLKTAWNVNALDKAVLRFMVESDGLSSTQKADIQLRVEGLGKSRDIQQKIERVSLEVGTWRVGNNIGLLIRLFRAALLLFFALVIFLLFIRWLKTQGRGSMTKYIVVSAFVHILCIVLVLFALKELQTIETDSLSAPVAVKIIKMKKLLGADLSEREQKLLQQEQVKITTLVPTPKRERIDIVQQKKKHITVKRQTKKTILRKEHQISVATTKKKKTASRKRTQRMDREMVIELPKEKPKATKIVQEKEMPAPVLAQARVTHQEIEVAPAPVERLSARPPEVSKAVVLKKRRETSLLRTQNKTITKRKRLTAKVPQKRNLPDLVLPRITPLKTEEKVTSEKVVASGLSLAEVQKQAPHLYEMPIAPPSSVSATISLQRSPQLNHTQKPTLQPLKQKQRRRPLSQRIAVPTSTRRFTRDLTSDFPLVTEVAVPDKKSSSFAIENTASIAVVHAVGKSEKRNAPATNSDIMYTASTTSTLAVKQTPAFVPVPRQSRSITTRQRRKIKTQPPLSGKDSLAPKEKVNSKAGFVMPQHASSNRTMLQRGALLTKKDALKTDALILHQLTSDIALHQKNSFAPEALPSSSLKKQKKRRSAVYKREPHEVFGAHKVRARITSITGDVLLKQHKKETRLLLKGDTIFSGATLVTSENSKVTIVFQEGSLVTLDVVSELTIGALIDLEVGNRMKSEISLLRGRLRFQEYKAQVRHVITFGDYSGKFLFDEGEILIDSTSHKALDIYMLKGVGRFIDSSTATSVPAKASSIITVDENARATIHSWKKHERTLFNTLQRRLK